MDSFLNTTRDSSNDNTLELEEEMDPTYQPTSQEIRDYGVFLGMIFPDDEIFLYVAKEALKKPMPEDWRPCQKRVHNQDEIFYMNRITHERSNEHPCDVWARERLKEEKERKSLVERFRTVIQTNRNTIEKDNLQNLQTNESFIIDDDSEELINQEFDCELKTYEQEQQFALSQYTQECKQKLQKQEEEEKQYIETRGLLFEQLENNLITYRIQKVKQLEEKISEYQTNYSIIKETQNKSILLSRQLQLTVSQSKIERQQSQEQQKYLSKQIELDQSSSIEKQKFQARKTSFFQTFSTQIQEYEKSCWENYQSSSNLKTEFYNRFNLSSVNLEETEKYFMELQFQYLQLQCEKIRKEDQIQEFRFLKYQILNKIEYLHIAIQQQLLLSKNQTESEIEDYKQKIYTLQQKNRLLESQLLDV